MKRFIISLFILSLGISFLNAQNSDTQVITSSRTDRTWVKLIFEKANEGRSLKPGMKLDPFSLTDFDGNVWDNARIAGHVTVINAWYSGCAPCRKEMPIISKWKDEFPEAYFLSVDYEDKELMKKIADKEGFTWTHLYNDRYFITWIAKFVGESGYPLTIVLGKDEKVKLVMHGTSEEKRAEIVKMIKTCLAE